MLLDPHLLESNNQSFAEADSMDKSTRELQGRLIELIGKYISMDSRYDPRQELLSVYFHEEWILDPESPQIIKKVKGITPRHLAKKKNNRGKKHQRRRYRSPCLL
jgi:DNA polymerase III epsilon subunit-like protein